MTYLTCIICPKGCRLEISNTLEVTGNQCPRGLPYAIEEITNPKRLLSTTVKTRSDVIPRLSVKSDAPLPKSLIFDVMSFLNDIVVEKNVKIGDIIVENILNTKVNIVATKHINITS